MEYIYFCRSSFCMGDDVCAPNMRRFVIDKGSISEADFRAYIMNYFTDNLPRFEWHGFCNGEFIASAKCSGNDDKYQVLIELSDNWKSLLTEYGTIYFDHHGEPYEEGRKDSRYYSFEKAEEYYNSHFYIRR